MIEVPYDRAEAVEYAKRWALKRNPIYLDFESMGGDCTNFASQCIFAGSHVMNYKSVYGWYYNSSHDRSASWSGVQYLHDFLTSNKNQGPYAAETDRHSAEVGDIIQLGKSEDYFYHSPVIVEISGNDILVCAHSFDAYMRPLSTYEYKTIRFLHIRGVRK